MARVYFTKPFDYYPLFPSKTVLIAYKAGTEHTVKQDCAEQAINAGHAIKRPAPRRKKVAE